MKAKKSKKTRLKQDCCDLCPDINEMAKKIEKKKKVKKKFSWKKITLPIAGILLLGVFVFPKLGSVLKTSEQTSTQMESSAKGIETKGPQINALAPDFNCDSFGPEPGAMAALARLLREIAVQSGLYVFAGGVLPSPDEVWNHAFEGHAVFFLIGRACPVH